MKAPSDGDSPAADGQQRRAGDDQQRHGGEHLGRSRAADGTEQRPHQVAPADQDRPRSPRRHAPHPTTAHGPAWLARRAVAQRDQRNEREVLEQQHREPVAPGAGLQQVALRQQRQHDGGGGHRQPGAQHHRARPADARQMRQPRQRRPARDKLRSPSPNTARRITHSRRGRSSSPIRNSSMTTPRPAILAISPTSVTSRSPSGSDRHARHQVAEHAAEARRGGTAAPRS